MTVEDLKTQLPDLVALLVALGQLLPTRVEPELVQFLDRAALGGVECELLHAALSQTKKAPPLKRFSAG